MRRDERGNGWLRRSGRERANERSAWGLGKVSAFGKVGLTWVRLPSRTHLARLARVTTEDREEEGITVFLSDRDS